MDAENNPQPTNIRFFVLKSSKKKLNTIGSLLKISMLESVSLKINSYGKLSVKK